MYAILYREETLNVPYFCVKFNWVCRERERGGGAERTKAVASSKT